MPSYFYVCAMIVGVFAMATPSRVAAQTDEKARLQQAIDAGLAAAAALPWTNKTDDLTDAIAKTLEEHGVKKSSLYRLSKNPVPAEILAWDSGDADTVQFGMLVQVAYNRLWLKRCHEDYVEWRAAWQRIDEQTRPGLTAAQAEPNPYTRMQQLFGVMGAAMGAAKKDGLLLKPQHPASWLGVPNEILWAMYDTLRTTRRPFATKTYFAGLGDQIAAYREYGRPFLPDDEERDLFCAASASWGTHRSPPLSDRQRVRPPVSDERQRAAKEVAARAASATAQRFVLDSPPVFELDDDSKGKADGKLVIVYNYVLREVQGSGDQTRLRLDLTYKAPHTYDCKRTGRIINYDGLNRPIYEENCKYGDRLLDRRLTLSWPDLPSYVKLQAGDKLSFYADVDKERHQIVSASKSNPKERWDYTATARHVFQVKRDEKVVYQF